MKRLTLVLAATCLALAFCSAPAAAVPITFIHTGSGSGSLEGVPFDVSAFTITAIGDTVNRTSLFPSGFGLEHDTASINIAGLGTLTFMVPTRTFVNDIVGVVGFSLASDPGLDLFDGPQNPAFAAWDMLSSIGPISGSGALMQWTWGIDVETNLGTLVFNDDWDMGYWNWDIPATFQAVVGTIPAPGAVLLGTLGAGLIGWLRRRRTL